MEDHRSEDTRLQVAMRPPEPHQPERAEAGVAHAMTEGGKAPVVPCKMGLRYAVSFFGIAERCRGPSLAKLIRPFAMCASRSPLSFLYLRLGLCTGNCIAL